MAFSALFCLHYDIAKAELCLRSSSGTSLQMIRGDFPLYMLTGVYTLPSSPSLDPVQHRAWKMQEGAPPNALIPPSSQS